MEKEEFLKLLPKLIREDDEVKGAILSVLSTIVPTKEDLDRRFEDLIKQMNERFEAVDKRFEAIDKRFEDLIKQMNERFEAVDKRFEAVDKRFETLIKQMNERFEAVDKRFETLIKQMNERFEAVDKRFETLIKQMNERFEAVDKRFEALIKQMNERFKAMDKRFDELKGAIDNIGDRGGKGTQEMVLNLLKEVHELKDIEIKRIERIELRDEEGLFFPKGYTTDIDILIENGKTILMEIKFKADYRDIYHFVQVSKLYEHLYKKPDELWVLTAEISPKNYELAAKYPVKLIYGKIK